MPQVRNKQTRKVTTVSVEEAQQLVKGNQAEYVKGVPERAIGNYQTRDMKPQR